MDGNQIAARFIKDSSRSLLSFIMVQLLDKSAADNSGRPALRKRLDKGRQADFPDMNFPISDRLQ
jgi:hypothetical protein